MLVLVHVCAMVTAVPFSAALKYDEVVVKGVRVGVCCEGWDTRTRQVYTVVYFVLQVGSVY